MVAVADPGQGPGGPAAPPPPLFLDQTEAWRAENFFWDRPTLLIWKSGSATGLIVQRSSSTNEHLHSVEQNVVAVTENLNTFLLVWTHVSR